MGEAYCDSLPSLLQHDRRLTAKTHKSYDPDIHELKQLLSGNLEDDRGRVAERESERKDCALEPDQHGDLQSFSSGHDELVDVDATPDARGQATHSEGGPLLPLQDITRVLEKSL